MKNKLIILFASFLLFIGFFLVFRNLFISDGSITVINSGQSSSQLLEYKGKPILKGEKVSEKFIAESNNLGGVSLRFDNRNMMSTDSLIFRLKDEESKILIYEGIYKVDQFQPNKLFPFGFSIIPNSKNKYYSFEVESVGGTLNNSISISSITPLLSLKYQYSKDHLTTPRGIYEFIYTKIRSLITNKEFLISVITYLFPFIILILLFNRKFKKRKILISLSLLLVILIGLFSNEKYSVFVPQIIIGCWLITALLLKISSKYSVVFALFFCFLSGYFVISNQKMNIDKSIMWTYAFISISIFHTTVEQILLMKNQNNNSKKLSK